MKKQRRAAQISTKTLSVKRSASAALQMTVSDSKRLLEAIRLHQSGNVTAAEPIYRTLFESYPDNATILHLLGLIHVSRGNVLEGIRLLNQAIALKPDFAEAYYERAAAQTQLAKYDEELASFDKAIAIQPDYANAYCAKGLLKLMLGEFEEGWQLNEWRWKGLNKNGFKEYAQPLWLGNESLDGKTIFLYPEQGLGDAIQFCRYVSMVEALGAKVMLGMPTVLASLMSTLKGSFRLITEKDDLPEFDFVSPLLSLPLAFGTSVNSIPANIPYLFIDPNKRKVWQDRLGEKKRPRIGLVWSGGTKHKNDHKRSIPLKLLAPFLQHDFEFHSFQKEIRPDDGVVLSEYTQIFSHNDDLKDFSDTAALISEMDLVISVDTSVAHLAGALGKPVWILIPFVPDFRWMTGREDSPWYPTARLFRQSKIGDWASVIERVKLELEVPHTLKRFQ